MTLNQLPFPPASPAQLGGIPVWWHGAASAHAVVMCGAHGPEAGPAYHAWCQFAGLLVQRGLAVFRFDWPGDGDAPDVAPGLCRITAAIEAVRSLVAAAAALPGVQAVSVIALGLGGVLASRALVDRPVDHLVLMQTPASGRRYLRRLQAEARLSAGFAAEESGGLAVRGHLIPAAEMAAIAALELAPLPAARTGLIVPAEGGGAVAEGWETLPFEGYAEMMSPASMLPPVTTFAAIAARFDSLPARTADWSALDRVSRQECEGGSERFLRLGQGNRLGGVLCRATAPAPYAPCVIMPNAGPNPHQGWGRMAVEHSRRLARAGIASLRFDLGGLGDSVCDLASPRAALYSRAHHADLADAIDLAKAEGFGRIVLSGLCAGGYLAFHAACSDPRVDAAVCANVLTFDWTEDDSLDAYERAALQSDSHYRAMALSGSAWRRIASGEVSVRKAAMVAWHLGQRAARTAAARFGLETGVPAEARRLRALVSAASARGLCLTLASSEDDPSRAEAERRFGPRCRAISGLAGVTIAALGESDHELSNKKARDRLLELIAGHALARPLRAG